MKPNILTLNERLKENALDYLYLKEIIILLEKIADLINSSLPKLRIPKDGYTTFFIVYKHKKYFNEIHKQPYTEAIDIHPSIEPELDKFHLELEALNIEKNKTALFLNNILNELTHVQQAEQYLPEQLHSAIPRIIIRKSVSKIDEEKVDQFKRMYKKEYDLLNERLITNLLLKG